MYSKLVEASKLQISKGAYQLAYDEQNNYVQVLERRSGQVNYEVCSDQDEMLVATIIYFGLRYLQ
jgi:hypothetical protein